MNTDRLLLQDLQRRVSIEDIWTIQRAVALGRDYNFPGNVRPLYQALLDVAQVEGVRVNRVAAPPGRALRPDASGDGWKPSEQQGGWISVHALTGQVQEIGLVTGGNPLDVQARSLLHEEGHLFTPNLTTYDRHDAEIIAESAAWIVGKQLGFRDDHFSPSYVADWTRHDAGDWDTHPERVGELELPILTTARRLGDAIDREYSFRRVAA